MDIETKLDLVRQVGEEIITEDDLRILLETNDNPIAYDGFEPSGNIHIAQGLLRTININKMLKAGVRFKLWVADWFGWMNNKMGGDLDKIKTVGEYFIEVWRACGLDVDKVDFLWASDEMDKKEYWKLVIQIARNNTVKRITRCAQIMGRNETESLSAAQIFYPCMQCADIFHLKADIAQLGMDQRKVNMLAREIGPALKFKKPVAVHHHMLMGLTQPPATELSGIDKKIAMKMSKSKPDTAIFMTDPYDEIKRKFKKAYCPEKIIEENPVMEYAKYIVFERFDTFKVERPEKYGGDLLFNTYDELCQSFVKGELHPFDLKMGIADHIEKLIEPVRKHFETNTKARALLEKVESFKTTR
ncbi:tyrosine--tRNA ligase [Candidatus Woesearchaeota archaeon CG11_big_fil_rev_8_21_14_0_20_43_8]|nr:MAG: tyrosine--tRNA ligase [Candidatus Woesearchaeota archaeon CG11_big_fil_rev_8_21_14_0_20_43_8]PIO07054.1 MAG: tyrosine--tRNA ligase [Candidatus Woesearchaeota archaeon CG08_land_8_20_14_0_20_43_7]